MIGIEPSVDDFVVTLFWSRLRDMTPADVADYAARQERLTREVEKIPGFVCVKPYTAADGERLSVVVFDSEEAQRRWGAHPGHVETQRVARERFYDEYQIVIARALRHHRWRGQPARPAMPRLAAWR